MCSEISWPTHRRDAPRARLAPYRTGTGLAARAEVTAAPGDDYPPNRLPTATAGLSGPSVDLGPRQEAAGPAIDVDIVAEARPLEVHGTVENFSYGPMQPESTIAREPSRDYERVDARFEKRLIRVDVPEAREQLLVHEPALDGAAPAS